MTHAITFKSDLDKVLEAKGFGPHDCVVTNPDYLREVVKDTKRTYGIRCMIRGNSKLGRNILAFNLPAGGKDKGGTCKPTKWCNENCYAQKGNFVVPRVKDSNAKRYAMSQDPIFWLRVYAEIALAVMSNRKKAAFGLEELMTQFIRIHSGGDFYGANYVEAWRMVVFMCRINKLKCKFLAFTKSITMGNGALVQSLENLAKEPHMALYESNDESRAQPRNTGWAFKAYVQDDKPVHPAHIGNKPCPGSCITCKACWSGEPVLFHKH